MSDLLESARHYARGYLAGESAAVLDEASARHREAVALVALRELGATPTGAREILEQAKHDAFLAVPDCTEQAARLIGADMVISILRMRLAREAA